MTRPGSRQHRLPPLQRLDYTLRPAPLDFSSLPTLTEKSPFPAIIVTPSSPRSTQDYSIAFIYPPPKPPLLQRLFPTQKARTAIILVLMLLLLLCHVATHTLATRRPFMELTVQHVVPGEDSTWTGWFGKQSWLGMTEVKEDKRDFDFVITEVAQKS